MTHIAIGPGRLLDLMNPDPALIDLGEIAEGLAQIKRFGPLRSYLDWTVAQHTVLVAELCSDEAKPYALLHDAHEHFLGDDVTPKKQAMARAVGTEVCDGLEVVQARLDRAIHRRAELLWPGPVALLAEVKEMDLTAYVTEIKHLMPPELASTFDLSGLPFEAPASFVREIAHSGAGALRAALMDAFPRAFIQEASHA
jgi:hypothetical protein